MTEGILHVKMFETFSIEWNGKRIIEGKARESQFAYLMQLVLHNRENGISREELKQGIFEERDLENENHALRSVIYNARKRLRAAGLPEVPYIEQRDGRYYWTDAIPVWEDASEMERLCQAAKKETDQEQKLSLYLDACHLYTGEFLSTQGAVVWVVQEAKRYHSLFCKCVERAVEMLRERQDFLQMEELGIYAAKVDPLADWEIVTMEALVSTGRHLEVKKFYNDTLELYFRAQGLRPSKKLHDLMNLFSAQMEHSYAVLDDIQRQLTMGERDRSGGYLCSYPVFQGIYQMVRRMMERDGKCVYLMLCTVVDSKGIPMREGPKLEELSQRLGDAICHAVRQSDAINKYGKGQFLVLLVNTSRENCGLIQKRINQNFIVGRQRTGIQYHVNSVACSLDQGHAPVDKEEKICAWKTHRDI